MANTLSASKRARQAERRRDENRANKATYRSLKKGVIKALESGNKEEAEKQFRLYSSAVDKAVKRNVIHRNSAARHKSAVSKLLKAS